MKQPSYPCSCTMCRKETTTLGIHTHLIRMHGTNEEKSKWNNNNRNAAINNKLKKKRNYSIEPNKCKNCDIILDYDKRRNIFCTSSCSASYNNKIRDSKCYIMSCTKIAICNNCNNEYSLDPRCSIKNFTCRNCKKIEKKKLRKCRYCNNLLQQGTKKFVCIECQHLKWRNNANQFSFKFNVFDYPDLFDLDLLKQIGWVSFGGKRGGPKNLKGLSRDHKVSVSDAKKYKYDPYYISHPCNCQLITQLENSSKNSKSSIEYQDLIRYVDDYDSNMLGRPERIELSLTGSQTVVQTTTP